MDTHPTAPAAPERRGFLLWMTGLVGAVATLCVAIPFVGYLAGALLKRKSVGGKSGDWVPLGKAGDFKVDDTRMVTFDNPLRTPWDGMTAQTGVYVCNLGKDGDKERFRIFAINCAHLGCPVSWFPQSGLFLCPCHGGAYYADGERASGPPPRGLYQCDYKVEGGELKVRAPHLPTLQDTLRKEPG